LVVSRGPKPEATVVVPDLRGVDEDKAIATLEELGLVPGERVEAFDPDIPKGAIVSTKPAADEEVGPGSSVSYVVSLGPEPPP
jgi:serine/threonine-protein kinase